MITYTKDELMNLYKKDLVALAEFYTLDISSSMKKEEIADELVEYFSSVDVAGFVDSDCSVRIKRVREANRS